jgi:hypothetical protein
VIDGVIKNQLDKYATGCNTQIWRHKLNIISEICVAFQLPCKDCGFHLTLSNHKRLASEYQKIINIFVLCSVWKVMAFYLSCMFKKYVEDIFSLHFKSFRIYIYIYIYIQIRRPGFDSRHYKRKKIVVGLERGPLSLVSTIEELLDRKVAAPV